MRINCYFDRFSFSGGAHRDKQLHRVHQFGSSDQLGTESEVEVFRFNRGQRTQLLSSGRQFELKEATLYGAFRRLEELGYISSYWGDEQTGARRRYYSVTGPGREAFRCMVNDWRQACALIESMIVLEEEQPDE